MNWALPKLTPNVQSKFRRGQYYLTNLAIKQLNDENVDSILNIGAL